MLDPKTWLDRVKHLPEGASDRFEHDCGPGLVLKAENKPEGFSCYCFRCAEPGFVPHGRASLAELVARLNRSKQADAKHFGDLRMPPLELDPSQWPRDFRVWMYKAGFSNDDIRSIRAGYHDKTDRVYLPWYEGDKLRWYVARSLDKERVKYLAPRSEHRRGVFPTWGQGRLVLTEDMLSAYRVGNAGAGVRGCALLGTKLDPSILCHLLRTPPIIWLDPDAAGQRAAGRIIKDLRVLGVEPTNIVSTRDPKLYSNKEIREWLVTK